MSTTPYSTPHLDTFPSAYRHHLAEHLATSWREAAHGAVGLAVSVSLAWAAYTQLDAFWGAALVGVVLVMAADWVRDLVGWPAVTAMRSAHWYGPDRIVHRQGVGPVQVLDVDIREELAETWVLVRRIGSPENPASWVPLGEVSPSPEGLTGVEGGER